jgi:hypothetical protein
MICRNRSMIKPVQDQELTCQQRMSSMYDLDTVMPRIQPQCFSTTSLKHKLVPSLNQGWEEWAWKDKVSEDIPISHAHGRCPRNPYEVSDGERLTGGA